MSNHSLLIFALLALTGCLEGCIPIDGSSDDCFNSVKIVNGKLQPLYCREEKLFRTFRNDETAIEVPGNLFKFTNNDGSVVFDSNPTNNPPFITDYTLEFITILPDFCSPDITGASAPSPIANTNGSTTWGKVDYFDIWKGDFPTSVPPLCRPAGGETGAAYVLCSEKDGKRVLICITQVTDNPKLAEQIFRSFHWTD